MDVVYESDMAHTACKIQGRNLQKQFISSRPATEHFCQQRTGLERHVEPIPCPIGRALLKCARARVSDNRVRVPSLNQTGRAGFPYPAWRGDSLRNYRKYRESRSPVYTSRRLYLNYAVLAFLAIVLLPTKLVSVDGRHRTTTMKANTMMIE